MGSLAMGPGGGRGCAGGGLAVAGVRPRAVGLCAWLRCPARALPDAHPHKLLSAFFILPLLGPPLLSALLLSTSWLRFLVPKAVFQGCSGFRDTVTARCFWKAPSDSPVSVGETITGRGEERALWAPCRARGES